jgi:hypothetical protein
VAALAGRAELRERAPELRPDRVDPSNTRCRSAAASRIIDSASRRARATSCCASSSARCSVTRALSSARASVWVSDRSISRKRSTSPASRFRSATSAAFWPSASTTRCSALARRRVSSVTIASTVSRE